MNHQPWKTRSLRLLVLFLLFGLLTACGGRKAVVTQDDSADYRSAVSLPPLKKSQVLQNQTASAQAPVIQPATTQQAPADQVSAAQSAVSQPVDAQLPSTPDSTVTPVPTATVTAADIAAVKTTATAAQSAAVSSGTTQLAKPSFEPASRNDSGRENAPQPISTQIIEGSKGGVVLQISAGASEAWKFLREQLNLSDITVHARNQKAGRFAIGCGGIETDSHNSTETKSGGWTILRRASEEAAYCAMQMVAKKSSSEVTIVGRDGNAVSKAQARALFQRLLASAG